MHVVYLLLTSVGASDDLSEYLSTASEMRRSNRLTEAEAVYRSAVQAFPSRAEPWFFIGLQKRATDRPLEALAAYRAALRLTPGMGEAHMNAASLLSTHERPEEALHHYGHALTARKWDARVESHAEYNSALALQQLGRPTDAIIAALRRSLQLTPDFEPSVELLQEVETTAGAPPEPTGAPGAPSHGHDDASSGSITNEAQGGSDTEDGGPVDSAMSPSGGDMGAGDAVDSAMSPSGGDMGAGDAVGSGPRHCEWHAQERTAIDGQASPDAQALSAAADALRCELRRLLASSAAWDALPPSPTSPQYLQGWGGLRGVRVALSEVIADAGTLLARVLAAEDAAGGSASAKP